MIRIAPVQFCDIKQLQEFEGVFFTGVNDEFSVRTMLENSRGFSMKCDGLVLAAGGVIMQWPGVGLLWMMVSSEIRKYPKLLLRESRNILELLRINGHIHRFQAYVDPSESRHIRFIEALGFTLEGRMIKHTMDGKDHLLYARTY